jgi:hypothetical protein
VAKVHQLNDDPSNLAWTCTQCNLHKGTNLSSIDPETSSRVDLYHPRQQKWVEHFHIAHEARIVGITAVGRATARLLDMNGSPQLELRRELIEQAMF